MTTERSDRGFTLVEVLVVTILTALIVGVLAAVFSVIVRTRPAAEARAEDARSLLGVTTWFPGDVNSTPRQVDTPTNRDTWWNTNPVAGSSCVGAPTGTNLIRLRWTEQSGGTSTFESSYVVVNDNGWHIRRVACESGQPAQIINLTGGLPDPGITPPSVTLKTEVIGSETYIIGAAMTVVTLEGESLRVDALSESPNETLPTVPVGSTIPPATSTSTTAAPTTSTTSTTTTTVAPGTTTTTSSTTSTTNTSTTTTTTTVPCSVSGISVSPTTVENQPKNNGNNDKNSPLTESVTVTVTGLSGNCSGLQLRYAFEADGNPSAKEESDLFGNSTQIIFVPLSTERWEDGTHTLVLYDALLDVALLPSTSFEVI